ncbi:MAG: cytidylyltransferase domain-containing protein [Kofleriaceae bacterium]
MTTTVVIQARTGSSRLPGKVLLEVAGAPVLQRMLERVTQATRPDRVVVATTEAPADDSIVDLARRAGVDCIRGHATDLLDRHLVAARATNASAIVKIPSDCPLIDPATIDLVIGHFLARASELDFVSNLNPPTWPDGFDVEVMTRDALEIAARDARRSIEREHTTPFLWDNPDRFRCANVLLGGTLDYSLTYRLTLDFVEDYQVISAIYDALWSPRYTFTLADIIALLAADSTICAPNAHRIGATWISNHHGELRSLAHHGGLR